MKHSSAEDMYLPSPVSVMPKCRQVSMRNGDRETPNTKHLEHQSRTLRLLVTTAEFVSMPYTPDQTDDVPELEVLASLQRQLELGLALDALQSQHDLLGSLGLLVEDGLGLTTITRLLAVVTSLTLGKQRSLAGLVLSDLVLGVLAAILALAVGVAGLGNVDLCDAAC